MDVYMLRARDINLPIEQSPARIDCETLETIYNQYYKSVYNYISFRINNHFDSEELASSVFENAIRKFHTYKPGISTIEAWLIGIAKNIVTDYLRGKKRKSFVTLDSILELASLSRQPEEVAVINEENKALIQAMSKLKEQERQALSMKFATGLRNNEIAQILNISDSNAGVMIHRATKKLRRILEREWNI